MKKKGLICISNTRVIIKPGKNVKITIDNIEYEISIKNVEPDHHELMIHDLTNDIRYSSLGTSVINLKVFESKPVSHFDSNRISLHRTNNIELEII